MREISVPPLVTSPPETNATDFVLRQAASPANPVLFSRPDGQGGWVPVRATEFAADAALLAKGLIAKGLNAGDRVGLMARTRYEWTLVDFAIWFAGGVSVPVYETSSPSQLAWILGDSGASAAVVEAPQHENAMLLAAQQEGLGGLRHVWQIEGGGLDALPRPAPPSATRNWEDRHFVPAPQAPPPQSTHLRAPPAARRGAS